MISFSVASNLIAAVTRNISSSMSTFELEYLEPLRSNPKSLGLAFRAPHWVYSWSLSPSLILDSFTLAKAAPSLCQASS